MLRKTNFLVQAMTTCRMLQNTKTTFLKMDLLPLFSPNFHIFLPPKPLLSLELSRPLIQRVTWLLLTFYDRKPRLLSDLLLSHFKLVSKKVWLVTVLTIILLFPQLLVLLLQHSLVEKIKLVFILPKLT